MPDSIQELYENQAYPPMSHPLSDPAVSSVAARMGGLETAHPSRARVLEIGCCSGHNLIPLAMRWPGSRFTGIDLVESSIADARRRAAAAGVVNISFVAADLMDFEPDGPFDFIIAHGFFSWVPDRVKMELLAFCHRHLGPRGIATISFNLECGWKARMPVIAKVRGIQQLTGGGIVPALEILRTLTDKGDPELDIIDDMLAKGAAILAFDDFGPVNDPWPLDRFARAAADAGLSWLGESDPGENMPRGLETETLDQLKAAAGNPLEFQMAVDAAAGRTFRSGVLCRNDAPVTGQVSLAMMLDFAVRTGSIPSDGDALALEVHRAIQSFAPACVALREVAALLPDLEPPLLARRVFEGITRGWVRPRIEPVSFASEPPDFPKLDGFRLACACERLPLVDVWHVPCSFPVGHYQVLEAMDGSKSRQQLAELSREKCPDLAFDPWLRHLAGRGIFAR